MFALQRAIFPSVATSCGITASTVATKRTVPRFIVPITTNHYSSTPFHCDGKDKFVNLNDEFDHPSDSHASHSHSHSHASHHTHNAHHGTPSTEERFGGMDRDIFKYMVEEMAPFMKRVFKIQLKSVTHNELHVSLPYSRTLVGNIAVPCLHGGVVASVIDHVGGFASWGHLEDPFLRVNTADLRVDYLSPAPCEELQIIATVQHRSKRLIRTDVVVYDKEMKKKIAIGRCLFNIYREGFSIQEVMGNFVREVKDREAKGLPPFDEEEE